jgi:hypothetical protein
MFTVKITKGSCYYTFTCPHCNGVNKWNGSCTCRVCSTPISLYVEAIDTDVSERIFYHLKDTYIGSTATPF